MAAVLETRLRQAQSEAMAPIDLIACLVSDEITLRTDRLRFNAAVNRPPFAMPTGLSITSTLPSIENESQSGVRPCTAAFINKREEALFLGPGGTGKSHLAQAIGQCAILQGY